MAIEGPKTPWNNPNWREQRALTEEDLGFLDPDERRAFLNDPDSVVLEEDEDGNIGYNSPGYTDDDIEP